MRPVKRFVSRFVTILWLMAALSLVGWLIVNLDTAGWILVILTTSLMTFELTRQPVRRRGPAVRPKSHPLPDEPTGLTSARRLTPARCELMSRHGLPPG